MSHIILCYMLVVDVRNNGGGNSTLCDILLSWLKPVNEMKHGSALIRMSGLLEKSQPDLAGRYKKAIEDEGAAYRLGAVYDSGFFTREQSKSIVYDELFVYNTDPDKVFRGNVVFIQNDRTYSSAGMLISDAADNGIGIVIGSESSFSPCNYGDMLGWKLPETGISGYVSYKYFRRPDSAKCGETAIRPSVDIPLTWDDSSSGEDMYWRWIVEKFGLTAHPIAR